MERKCCWRRLLENPHDKVIQSKITCAIQSVTELLHDFSTLKSRKFMSQTMAILQLSNSPYVVLLLVSPFCPQLSLVVLGVYNFKCFSLYPIKAQSSSSSFRTQWCTRHKQKLLHNSWISCTHFCNQHGFEMAGHLPLLKHKHRILFLKNSVCATEALVARNVIL